MPYRFYARCLGIILLCGLPPAGPVLAADKAKPGHHGHHHPGPAKQTAIRNAVRAQDRQWRAAIAEQNLDDTLAVYVHDALLKPPRHGTLNGKALKAYWARLLKRPDTRLKFIPDRLDVGPGGKMAFDTGTVLLLHRDKKTTRVTATGRYLTVWKQRQGQWKVVADMFTTDLPGKSGETNHEKHGEPKEE